MFHNSSQAVLLPTSSRLPALLHEPGSPAPWGHCSPCPVVLQQHETLRAPTLSLCRKEPQAGAVPPIAHLQEPSQRDVPRCQHAPRAPVSPRRAARSPLAPERSPATMHCSPAARIVTWR